MHTGLSPSAFSNWAVLCIALALAPLASATGTVDVRFEKPAEFSDAGRGAADREQTMQSLSGYLQSLGALLPDGQSLRLDVLDIDLAGELRPYPQNSGTEVRVLSGRADAPHIKLRYTLQEGGRTLKAGEARVADLAYLFSSPGDSLRFGDLPHEKRMLQQWFKDTLISNPNPHSNTKSR